MYVNDKRYIRVFDSTGKAITEFGGLGNKIGKLAAPAQIALDGAGNLWVADRGNNRVQQFGPDGERLLTFGARGIGPGEFINPTGVSVDCRGTLTVTDTQNNRVQQFALAAPPAVGVRRARPARQPAAAQAADAAAAARPAAQRARAALRTGSSPRACCRCASAATRSAR